MIFKQIQQVLDGTKRQTRRPVKEGEYAIMQGPDLMEWEQWRFDGKPARLNAEDPLHQKMMKANIIEVRDAKDRLKWKVGKDYAVQPGRGKRSVGRIRITKIRRERLWEISDQDLLAEGFHAKGYFIEVWNSLYRKPHRREENPEVWVLEFEGTGKEEE